MMADAIADTISRYFKQLHLQNSCNYIKKFIAIFLFIGQRGVKYWRKYDDRLNRFDTIPEHDRQMVRHDKNGTLYNVQIFSEGYPCEE